MTEPMKADRDAALDYVVCLNDPFREEKCPGYRLDKDPGPRSEHLIWHIAEAMAPERERARRERELYKITVKDDGTWLELSGPTKMASIRLENGHGPIVRAAIREVREALAAAEAL